MKNIDELNDQLADNFMKLKNGEMEVKEVEAMNNTAGKMIQIQITKLKEIDIVGARERIPFLNGGNNKELAGKNEAAQIEA